METKRQKKVAKAFQQELSEIFRREAKDNYSGNLISVTKVTVTPDIATAKVYLSIFPTDNSDNIIKDIKEKAPMYRTMIAKSAAKNMRFAPELLFYLDVSLDKMEKIERALKGKGDNPIL